MRTILITGCSSGIGFEAALAFARAGDEVYASMRDCSKGESIEAAAVSENLKINVIELDVTKPNTFRTIIDMIIAKSGRLDVLVNNAGVLPIGAFEDVSEQELRQTMEINFFGPAFLSQAVLPAMRRQNEGYIIMLSSLSGMASKSGDAAYAASKFALEGLTEGFRNEIARWNIKSALVEPAQYATNIFRNVALSDAQYQSPYAELNKSLVAEMSGDTSEGLPPDSLARLLVEISKSDGATFRWAADKTAERVMSAMFAHSDSERSQFLRDIANIDWWINGHDNPNTEE